MRKEGGFFMDPKVKTGIGAAQKGMKVAKVGKKALDMKKKLPGILLVLVFSKVLY